MQRPDDVAGDRDHGAEGKGDRKGEQHDLHHQRALRRRILDRREFPRLIERALGHGDRGAHALGRHRGPLIRSDVGLWADHDLIHQFVAQRHILRVEIGRLCRGHRTRQIGRQLHPPSWRFQAIPGGFDAADEFGVGLLRFQRQAAGGHQSGRDQIRGFSRGVSQQPGCLLDRKQLVDDGVVVIDGGGEVGRDPLKRCQQRFGDVRIVLG